MPVAVTLPKLDIESASKEGKILARIVDIYNECLGQMHPKEVENVEVTTQASWWQWLRGVTNEQVYFPSLTLELEVISHSVLQRYRNSLDQRLWNITQKNSSVISPAKDGIKIKNSDVLIIELLYRLLAISLSPQMIVAYQEKAGISLSQLLDQFLNQLNENRLIQDSALACTDLGLSGKQWVEEIKRMEQSVKFIHAHRQTLTEYLDTVVQAQYLMRLHLCCLLNPQAKSHNELTVPHNIANTLKRYETECADLVQKQLNVASHNLIQRIGSHSALTQAAVFPNWLEQVCAADRPGNTVNAAEPQRWRILVQQRQLIQSLYQSLNENDCVYKMLGHLDMLFHLTGLTPLLGGFINFPKLNAMIVHHRKSIHLLTTKSLQILKEILTEDHQARRLNLVISEQVMNQPQAAVAYPVHLKIFAMQDESIQQVSRSIHGLFKDISQNTYYLSHSFLQLANESQSTLPTLPKFDFTTYDMIPYMVSDTNSSKSAELYHRFYACLTQPIADFEERKEQLNLFRELGVDFQAIILNGSHDYTGLTPLHAAARARNTEVFQWLLEQNIPHTTTDIYGRTVLQLIHELLRKESDRMNTDSIEQRRLRENSIREWNNIKMLITARIDEQASSAQRRLRIKF